MTAVVPAGAVTNGALDGDGHPYVGLMVAKDDGGDPLWRCTGTLLSETLFLTAGHCTEAPAVTAEIWFDADVTNAAAHGYPFDGDVSGTTYTHPQYDPNAFFLFDLGVVVLDEPVVMATYGALPTLNQLDSMKPGKRSTFTSVGYGLQRSFPDAASWKDQALRIRMVAHPHLLQINTPGFTGDYSLLLSNNARTGGTCFGDSGGPNFIGDSNVVAGVTSFGINPTCGGTGGVYRIDRADDLNWLYGTFGRYLP
ncbi:MAG TPA: trypsin-like serine protease [Candidatus Limnocylindria bacterium]|nr:trypsin-like serine protease [Candidatus Limnocylindria bacterium]